MRHFLLLAVLTLAPPAHAEPAAVRASGIHLESVDYPFVVQRMVPDAERPHDVMAYMDVKPAGVARADGGVVLLLHGKNFNGDAWGRTATDLAGRGWRVVVPDQIGWGKSSKPLDVPYSFHRMAGQTAALLDHLGIERAVVMGHSMGGMLATRMALSFPDRTASLVLLNPIGLEDWRALTPYRSVEQWERQELGKTRAGIKAYMRASYYDGRWDPAYDRGVDLLAAPLDSPDYPRLARASALQYEMIYTQPVVHELPRVAVPTLLLIGTRDRTALNKDLVSDAARVELGRYDRLGRTAAQAIPGATLVEFPGVGHLPQVEAYGDYLAALTGFLER